MSTPEHWQQVKQLFNSAMERPAEERTAFLRDACGDDAAILDEVESLISAHEQDEEFLKGGAHELMISMLEDDSAELVAGQQIGPYTILASLGMGGMGEVYLAQDSRLGRKVALKLLAPEFARDEQRVLRFALEARAASALNHPNVCVIHEVGRTDEGRHFMAMEYIEGVTLRRRLRHRLLTIKEALDVAAQVAWALEAAHAAGIVHRDIKPENIMLRNDGYVKILDFGIAKLSVPPPESIDDIYEASTIAQLQTEPGTRMGTIKYMSPEQLRELVVDERTDIWSLGVVLHEMVTGITPFEAPTTNDVIANILENRPVRLVFDGLEAPEEFQQLVRKALSKRRGERYQTIKEFALHVRQLRRPVSVEAAPEPVDMDTVRLDSTNERRKQQTDRNHGGTTLLGKVKAQAVSTFEHVFSEVREHPTVALCTGVVTLAAVFVFFIVLPTRSPPLPPETAPLFQKMTPLTNSGKSVCSAISPDGKLVAHAEELGGRQELVITGLTTFSSSVLVPVSDLRFRGVTFSPDSNYLYFTTGERGGVGVLHQVALPGGSPRKIMSSVDSPITFSPSGDRFAFVRFNEAGREYALMIADIDGSGERILATRRDGNTLSVYGPAWSPDGTAIACAAGSWDSGYHMKLVEVDVAEGREKPIGQKQWYLISQVAWLQGLNGKSGSLIVSASEQWTSPAQLWRVSYPQGEPVRLVNDTTSYERVSVSRDGHTLVTIASHRVAQIWVAPDGDEQRAIPITSNVGVAYGLNWTSKGKIVFSSMAGSLLNIFVMNPDGSGRIQLTVNAGDNYTPATSPDGRFIVFASTRNKGLNIWRMNAEDGSEPKQLTFSDGNSYPTCSADGQWVFYDNQSTATFSVWKVPIAGGDAVQVTDSARMPAVSPDNQFIAARHYLGAGLREIAIFPFQGGQPVNQLRIPIMDWQRIQWSADGRALNYIDSANGAANLWSYDLANGSTRRLTNFKSDQIYAYAWSPDFKQLACERGTEVRDVTIITDQK